MSVRSQWRNKGGGWRGADFRHQLLGRFDGDIDKGDIGLLRGKGFNHRGADARAAAGDEDDLVDERRVAGKRHQGGLFVAAREGARLERDSIRRNRRGASRGDPAGRGARSGLAAK